jgi:hypothetical protein
VIDQYITWGENGDWWVELGIWSVDSLQDTEKNMYVVRGEFQDYMVRNLETCSITLLMIITRVQQAY